MNLGIYTNYRLQRGPAAQRDFHSQNRNAVPASVPCGVISPESDGARAIVVAACTADLEEQQEAGRVLERVGRAITATLLVEPQRAKGR